MDVKAVSNVSLQQSFEGKSKRKEHKNNAEYPQMDRPASPKAAKAMRNTAMGLLMLSAGLSSCVEVDTWAKADAKSWAWVINNNDNKPDTIFQTVPIKEVNFAINDSIIHQFKNIGAEIDGPLPRDGKNVILVSGTFRNRYDNKVIDFQVDSAGSTSQQNVYISKITDLYDPKNPKKQWVQTIAKDVPGKGIKYEFYTANSKEKPQGWQWNQSYSIIVSNGARGNKPGVNTIYDRDGNMIWKGQLTKGQQAGTFMYGVIALDEDGQPYIDPETGKPELVDYDFDNAKIWTREVEYRPFENPKTQI